VASVDADVRLISLGSCRTAADASQYRASATAIRSPGVCFLSGLTALS
jgi:hypothetical protein